MSKRPPPPDPLIILRGHGAGVTSLCFVSESSWLLSASDKGEVFVWSLDTFRILYKLPPFHGNSQILWLHDWRNYVLTQGRDGSLMLLQRYEGEWLQRQTVQVASLSFCKCSIVSDVTPFLAAPGNKTSEAIVVDLEKDAQTVSSLIPNSAHKQSGLLMGLKLVPERLLSAYECGDIMLWNWREQTALAVLNCYVDPVIALAFDTNLNKGIATSVNNELCVWNVTADNKLEMFNVMRTTNPGITTVDVRQDSRIVATGGSDGRVRVFSWKTMKALAVLNWHREALNCVQFSTKPNKKYGFILAAGSKDGQITLWSLYN